MIHVDKLRHVDKLCIDCNCSNRMKEEKKKKKKKHLLNISEWHATVVCCELKQNRVILHTLHTHTHAGLLNSFAESQTQTEKKRNKRMECFVCILHSAIYGCCSVNYLTLCTRFTMYILILHAGRGDGDGSSSNRYNELVCSAWKSIKILTAITAIAHNARAACISYSNASTCLLPFDFLSVRQNIQNFAQLAQWIHRAQCHAQKPNRK